MIQSTTLVILRYADTKLKLAVTLRVRMIVKCPVSCQVILRVEIHLVKQINAFR